MKTILLLSLMLFSFQVYSQSVLDKNVEQIKSAQTLTDLLLAIEKKEAVRFYFLSDWTDKMALSQDYAGKSLRAIVTELLVGTDISYFEVNAHMIVFVKDPTMALQHNSFLSDAAREQKKVVKTIIGDRATANVKAKVKLSGKIIEAKGKDPLAGVSVYIRDLKIGTVTNAEGAFELDLLPGKYIISCTYVNYEEKIYETEIYANGNVRWELDEMPTMLQEIIIQDRTAREITTSTIGLTQLSMKELKKAPALLGEVDLIKSIQVLPGVTTVGEAASGFNVRGGGVDQNLILYDGMPVFNSSHVFGFFSAFNSEAIRDVNFYRGGIPAEYGGRVSSVLDIRSKEGNYEKWQGSGGIGMISSNLMVNGPIKKDKTSIAASFRSTYSDWLINTVKSNYVDLSKSSVRFYDGAMKLTHQFSEKTKLTMSGYISNDQFRLQGDSTYRWNTMLGSIRLDHEFNRSFSGVLNIGYGKYQYDVFDNNSQSGFNLHYDITYPSIKGEVHYQRGNHKVSAGAQNTFYGFNPGTLTPNSTNTTLSYINIDKQSSMETGLYVSDQFKLFSKLFIDAGLRYSFFQSTGPASVYVYQQGRPRETLSIKDTLHFSKGQVISSYKNLEPRLGLRYELNSESSVKAGYNRMAQYLHLVTNSTAVTPVDIWQPSGTFFKPQLADQFSIGYFVNFKDKKYEAFVETYYKKIQNVLDFKDGANIILNKHIETDLLQGKARSYGIETQLAKNVGKLVGSIGYTYSRSFRTIQGTFNEESINNGREYKSNFDQPHVVNINWKYSITRRHFFTGGFTYRTGRPITLPLTGFSIENYSVSSFSDRNFFRIPDYHRLDIGFVIEGNHKRKKFWDGTWTFSIYNVYARKNPYSVYFKEVRPGILRPYQLSIIGTALPSISYSFKI